MVIICIVSSTFYVIVVTSPPRGAWSIAISIGLSVCLSVCPSARITRKPHCQTSANFYACCLWPWPGPSFSDCVAIRYVLSDLWMTSCFHTMWLMGENQAQRYDILIFCKSSPGGGTIGYQPTPAFGRVNQNVTPGAKSAIYDCLVVSRVTPASL